VSGFNCLRLFLLRLNFCRLSQIGFFPGMASRQRTALRFLFAAHHDCLMLISCKLRP
jgi:hypothetical protein